MRSARMRTFAVATATVAALTAAPLGIATAHAWPGPASTQVTVDYTADDGVLANPSRGFYHQATTHYTDAAGAGWTPLDEATVRSWRAENITQVLRLVYLEHFGGADGAWDLTPDLLRRIDADFATARRAGVGVILRFAYALPPAGVWPPPTPYGDAPVARTVNHIRSLGPVLRRNADVIETVQQGFIGLWGEGYFTDYFSDPADPSIVSDQNWADRGRVLHALLRELPKSVTVQERTMYMKQRIFDVPTGTGGALTPAQAFSGSDLSRVGFHNDCFLASPDDYGTFLSDPLSLDDDYLAADSRYVPVGGETCNVNPPKSQWPSARQLMERFHYSYLNTDYNQDVLDSWGEGYQETDKRLGYRFTLVRGTFSRQLSADRRMHVDLTVRNSGFASPYQERPAQLVLVGDHHTYRLALPADPRRWLPGQDRRVRTNLAVPTWVEPGNYRLAFALPSAAESLVHRADYAIRTANVGTWNAAKGWNRLGVSIDVGDRS